MISAKKLFFSNMHIMTIVLSTLWSGLYAVHTNVDNSFGPNQNGIVSTAIGGTSAVALKIDAQNNIVVAGPADAGLFVARYLPTGELDTTNFGAGNGYVLQTIGTTSTVNALAIQPDGKIVVTGLTVIAGIAEALVARFNTDGSLDTSFNTVGYTTSVIGDSAIGGAVAIQADGSILVGGDVSLLGVSSIFVARYTTSGILDTTFGTLGVQIVSNGLGLGFADINLQTADQKIVVVGATNTITGVEAFLTRLNTDGSTDTSFGTLGITTQIINSATNTVLVSAEIQPTTGSIVINGSADGAPFLARFDSAGALDTTFGTSSGFELVQAGAQIDGLVLTASEGIVTAGFFGTQFFTAQYTVDGIIDTTFGVGGIMISSLGGTSIGKEVAIDQNNKIVVGGSVGSDIGLIRYYPTNSPTITFVQPVNGSTITTFTTPINGYSSETNTTVEVIINGTTFATITTDVHGFWNAGTSSLLTIGSNSITANLMSGVTIIGSSTINLTVSATNSITIVSPADNATITDDTVTISGTSTGALVTVTVFLDGNSFGTTTTDSFGNWNAGTTSTLLNGVHTVTASFASVSDTNNFTIQAPDKITTTGIIFGLTTMTIAGTSTQANAEVIILVDGGFATTVTTASNGTWTTTISQAFVIGTTHLISAQLVNASGNVLALASNTVVR